VVRESDVESVTYHAALFFKFPGGVSMGSNTMAWLKAGAGIEGQLTDGKASLMLNGTTEGEAMSTWIAASYQFEF